MKGDLDDFAVASVPQTGSCFFGFPNNPFTLGPKPATGNGPANSCDFDLHVNSTLDGDENNDTGVWTYAITAGWASGQTSTVNLVVEIRDPGASTTIPEPATLTLAFLGMGMTLIFSRLRKPM